MFIFKAASINGEDNRIVIDCLNPNPSEDFIESNEVLAKALADKLDFWLTAASVHALVARLRSLGY